MFGVVHALTLANSIIRSETIERVIFDLLNGILNSEVDEWNVNSPIICHGYAGNLQILNRLMNLEYLHKSHNYKYQIMSKVNELEKRINDYFLYKFNFQENIIENKQIGILEGLSGIMLSLLSSHNISKSTWDGMLLLS